MTNLKVKIIHSRVRLFATPWTIAYQAPLCPWNSPGKDTGMGYYFLPQGIFPDPGTEPRTPTLQAGSSLSEPPGKPNLTQVNSVSHLV